MKLSRASPACGNCRSRRIKCNFLRPRCSQCARAGLECGGYRSRSELLFRDQTRSTIAKVHHEDSGVMHTHSPATCGDLPAKPTFHVDGLAQKVFTDNFPVFGEGCKSWMEGRAIQPSPSTISLTSVGLAALALVHKDPHMMDLARRKYHTAIGSLTTAIRHHGATGVEQSIAACFILSIFEVLTCDKSSVSNAWPKHILGATTFLGFICSDIAFPQSPVPEIIDICFNTVSDYPCRNSNSLLIIPESKALACLVSDITVPPFLLNLSDRFEHLNTITDDQRPLELAMHLFVIIGQLVNVHHSANRKMFTSSSIVAFATQSIQTLNGWADALPASWKYDRNIGKVYGTYSNVWYARIWNYYRLAHILANRILLDHLNFSSQDQSEKLIATISDISWDIYNTLPFLFDSERTTSASLPLSTTLFYITSIVQSLAKVTDQIALFEEWSIPASSVLGERFNLTRDIVIRNLRQEYGYGSQLEVVRAV
ncbi:unnamed protein product [Penicillium salamii]|uniref:Zn(2)-C6 fungal-type domain-containing protein n=1 Tax=Penicillium salamii TaxID=1612424 RepID=A0A9W4K2G7_9EURO|nr:unnamed protein product [Penicillium salamii]CAG7957014.1 unnamed protein product [Penicillium salamii]CAG8222423.1 unnamed protein product [Penicillium salamii]CAG8311223.1 unnamed protein product [Penicillium salamii]CAG8319206.1 unnamed protein product [Penicillium salamii]